MAKFKYNKRDAEYLHANGKPVSNRTMNDWARDAIDNAQVSLAADTQKLVDRKISISTWRNKMRDHIRGGHRMMAKLAYGPELSAQQNGRLGAIVKRQYKFLDNFAAQLRSKDTPRDARTINRANLYLQSLWMTYQNELMRAKQDVGYLYASNNLNAEADSCKECPDLTDKGYIPIADMPLIGLRECKIGCKCSLDFSRT